MLENHYQCPHDDAEWHDEWHHQCNDRCPECGCEIEPYLSFDLTDQDIEQRQDRYLRIVRWAQRRYTNGGYLVISRGEAPSIYTRIEQAAFRRYMAL